MPGKHKPTLVAVILSILAGTAPAARAATDVWSAHIATGDWRTTIALYNSAEQPVSFRLEKFTPDGKQLESDQEFTAPARGWFELPAGELSFEGTAHLTSPGDLLVKKSYRYLNSHSECEFYLSSTTGTDWLVPNTVRDWFSWTGTAFMNSSDSPMEVELKAYRNQSEVGSLSVRLMPRQKFARLSHEIWPGVLYHDFDTVRIRAGGPIASPISITGDDGQDRHLFFTAQKVSSTADTWNVWTPHVATGDWQTSITLFNASNSDVTFKLERFGADGSTIGDPNDYTIAANSWFDVPASSLAFDGSAQLTSVNQLLVKLGYRYKDSRSVCEFFLPDHLSTNWVIPNSVRQWLGWTGLALVNEANAPIVITLKAQQEGVERASTTITLPARSKYTRLSDQIWSNLGYSDFDTIFVQAGAPIPPPISITGDTAQDRHLFFTSQETPVEKLPWPHQWPGISQSEYNNLVQGLWIINNFGQYQASEDQSTVYFHDGLDVVLDNGTKIYAVDSGYVKAVDTGTEYYYSLTIGDTPGNLPGSGWSYTHINHIQFRVGDYVRKGDYIADIHFMGLAHVHLSRIYVDSGSWNDLRNVKVVVPDQYFNYVDTQPPAIETPFYYFRNNTNNLFQNTSPTTLSGDVDIVVGVRDPGEHAHSNYNFGDRLCVSKIDYRIQMDDGKEVFYQKSFDFSKIILGYEWSQTGRDRVQTVYKHYKIFHPVIDNNFWNKTFSYYILTNTDGMGGVGMIDPAAGNYCWQTAAVDSSGKAMFPDGLYRIAVTACDSAGNCSTATDEVRVQNGK